MEETQRLQSDEEEETVPFDRERPVGTLRMFSGTYGPAQDFPIYWGQNTIGREAKCDVTLPAQSVSKKHAVLEVQPGCHILYDLGSLNKTRKCKVALTPHVRYALADGELLLFADVACQYKIEAVPENKTGQVTEEETDDDSFLVPGTQNTLAVERTPAAVIRRMGIGRVLARDSGEEDEGEEEIQKTSLNKGEGGSSRGGLKISPTGTHFSRLSATFVPDSDEENDTSTCEHQFPSLNLRCDSDTDTHETPTRLGSDLLPSQDYVTSPTFISKKTQLTRDTSVSHEAGSEKSASTDSKEKVICERTDVENVQEDKPSEKNKDSTSHNSRTIVGDQAKDAEKQQEKGEIDVDGDKDMDSDTETVQSDVTKKKTDVVTDRDTDAKKDNATSVQKDVEIASVDHDSDRDVEEAEASKTNRKKPHLNAFNLDSDTDIEDEEAPLNSDVEKRELKMSLDNDTNKEDLTRFPTTAVKTKETSLVVTDRIKALDQADGNDSKANMEKILSAGLQSGTDVLQSNMKKRQTDKVMLDSDTDVEDDNVLQSDVKKIQTDKIILDSDTDGEEDIAKNVEIGLDSDADVEDQAKVSETDENKDIPDIQLDSDTDVEEDNTKSSMSKKTEIALDSDIDAEDDAEVSETGEKKNVPGIELDSDTDVEEDNTKSSMSKKTEIAVDSDTGAEDDAEAPETGEKKNVPGIELDSDTDVEESIMKTPVKTIDNKEASGINLDSDTDVEEEAKASAINIDPNTKVEEGADNNLKTEPTVYHLDSDTDVEDDPEVLYTDLQKGKDADSGNILQGDDKATTANMEESGTTTVHADSDKDVEEDSIQKQATSKMDDEKMESPEILLSKENIRTSKVDENIDVAIDSDTDVEEDTLAKETNVMKEVVSTNAQRTEEADSPCKDSIGDHETPKQEATEISAGEVEETQITDSEELDMMPTQCYLDPQEKETETPVDDNCAEDATQAYVFSSTWNEPDPFKRPADPIGVLQISAVTMNTSEEEVDDDAIAETQPFCFETTQTAAQSVKPVVQTDKETEQEATELSPGVETFAGPVSQDSAQAAAVHSEALQDDTEPISQHLATNVPVEKSAWQPLKRDGPVSLWAKSASYERQSAVEKRESVVEEEATQQYSLTGPATDLDATQDYCLNMGKGGNAIEGDSEEDATPLGNVVSSVEGCDLQSQDQNVPAAIAETCSLLATEGDAMQLSLPVTVNECKQPSAQATDGDETQLSVSSEEIDATQLFTLDMPAMEENDKELHMSPTEKNAIQPCILSVPASMSDAEQPCSQNVPATAEVENEEQPKEMSAKSVSQLKEQDQEVPVRIEKTGEERVLKVVNRRGKRTKGMGEEENKVMEEQNISSVSEKKRSKMAVEAIPSTSEVIKENTQEKVTKKSGAQKTAKTADSDQSGASPAPEEMPVSSAHEEQELMPSNKKTEIGTVEIALEMNESNNKEGEGKGDVCSTFKDSEEHLDGSVCKDVAENKESEEILGSSTKEQKHSSIKSRIGRAPKQEAENNEQEVGEDGQQSTTNRTNEAQISRRSLRGHQEEKQVKKMPLRRSGLRGSGKEEAAISSKTEGEPLKKKSVTRKSQIVTETSVDEEDIVGLPEPMAQNENVPGVFLTGTRSRRKISKGMNKTAEEDEGTQKNERVESTEKQTLKRKNTRDEKNEQEDHKKLEVPVTKSIARRGRLNLKDEEKGKIEQHTKSVEMLEEEPVRKSGRTQKQLQDQQGKKEEHGSVNIADGCSEKQEGDNVEKPEIEDTGKTTKRTRSNSREGMEADREKPVKTQISRRTRKNSREGVDNKEQDEKETKKQEVEEVENSVEMEDPIRKSRRTRTNSREDKEEMENPSIKPSSRRTRRNSKEEKQKATQENDGTETMEIVDPTKNISKRVRKNSKNEDNTEQEKNVSVAKKQIGKTMNRLKDHETAQVEEELEKTQSKDDSNVSKSTRLRSKKPSEDEKKESSESEELSLTIEQPRVGRSRRQAAKEASTPVPPRKRGRGSKVEEEEVKKKKTSGDTNEEADKEKTPVVGRRNQRNRLVANEPETDSINTQMSLSPAPSPTNSVRSRSRATSNSPSETTTPRRTNRSVSATSLHSKNVSTPKVLFTGVVDSAAEVIIRSLGGDVAESVSDCTHLVTDRVIRTVKFLCALARGIPIITLDWIYKCKKSGCFLSYNGFLVKDKVQEKNFNFNLSESLQKAKRKPLFEGYEIHVTPHVKPEPEQMKEIIQCSGATYLPKMPRSFKEKCVIVSCAEDLAKCKVAPATVPVTTAEFILSGILLQEADPSAYLLSAAEKEAAPIPAKRRR